MQIEELRAYLLAHAIPLHLWGQGQAKTLEHLSRELIAGEAVLTFESDQLRRTARGTVLDVFFQDGPILRHLWEAKQVFADGRERIREDLAASIGEKLAPDERPHEGAIRALAEELGITELLPLFGFPEKRKGPVPSASYPGLHTLYIMYPFQVFLPPHLYRPEGYIERQPDKWSYFEWREYAAK